MRPERIDLDTRLAVTDNGNFSSLQLLVGKFSEGAPLECLPVSVDDVDAMARFLATKDNTAAGPETDTESLETGVRLELKMSEDGREHHSFACSLTQEKSEEEARRSCPRTRKYDERSEITVYYRYRKIYVTK